MQYKNINVYFSLIKNNKSYLYTCNREVKILVGGEKISFDNYPFNDSDIIFKELCPWHQKTYIFKYPFIKNFDGNHIHCLSILAK